MQRKFYIALGAAMWHFVNAHPVMGGRWLGGILRHKMSTGRYGFWGRCWVAYGNSKPFGYFARK